MTVHGFGKGVAFPRTRGRSVVLVLAAVVLALGWSATGMPLGSGLGPPPSVGAAGPSAVLWVWPADKGGAVLSPEQQFGLYEPVFVFFRFSTAPPVESFAVTVEPDTPCRVYYCGETVLAQPWRLEQGRVYTVTLDDKTSGAALGRTRIAVALPKPLPSPRVTVMEGRSRRYPGVDLGEAGPTTTTVQDGDTAAVGFGDTIIDIFVREEIGEEDFLAAVTARPADVTYNYVPYGPGRTILQVRWPGISVEGRGLVDPLAAARSGRVPEGYAAEMTLSIDASRLQAFSQAAGEDQTFAVRVVRLAAPGFSVVGLDDSRVSLPYPANRDIFSLAPSVQRFRMTFNKPMDRGSVERTLILGNSSGEPYQTPGNLLWAFKWSDDRTLDFSIAPTPWTGMPTPVKISPEGALDQDGLPIWFTDYLALRWQKPRPIQRVPAPNLSATPEPVGVAPAGLSTLLLAADGQEGIALEKTRPGESGTPTSFCLWWWRVGTRGGRWLDCSAEVKPFLRACWLNTKQAFLARVDGWQIYRPGSIIPKPVILSRKDCFWLAFAPDPTGTKVAALRQQSSGASGAPRRVDLVLFGLDGREQAARNGVMSLGPGESFGQRVPLAWLPDGGGLVTIQPQPSGKRRLVVLNAATGALTPIPGADRVGGDLGDDLVVFNTPVAGGPPSQGSAAACCSAAIRAPDGGWGAQKVLNVQTGAEIGRVPFGDRSAPGPFEQALPAPDGSRLALVSYGTTTVLDLRGDTYTEVQGRALGWSPDGAWLYLAIGSDYEEPPPNPFPETPEGYPIEVIPWPEGKEPSGFNVPGEGDTIEWDSEGTVP